MKTKAVVDYIVGWLTDYCEKAGLNGFVTGISGGVDSAVTSTLCAKTGKTTHVLNLPIYQAADQDSLAKRHIAWLRDRYPAVKNHTMDLSPVLDSFQETLPKEIQDGLVLANMRSRIRMIALYAFAGHHGLLVTGTGNKVEDYGVGFFTKYGDGGVDIAPIADLMKSEVRMLAREIGILPEIADAVPTDGLWADNRSDEEQIGATYEELEWAMRFDASEEGEKDLTGRKKEVLAIYRRLNSANRHKMAPVPVAKIPDDLRR
ncbi:MAG: NAD(+) synthase [Desulfosalsimonadaceae bacterium]